MSRIWSGVLPAVTTPFTENLRIDHTALAEHARWMVDEGCPGVIVGGSLGEGATLRASERSDIAATVVGALGGRGVVIAAVASLSTAEAIDVATAAGEAGVDGLMVLPPYAYSTDEREMTAHVGAVLEATHLPCMLYNNPLAYVTDYRPEHILRLAHEFPQLQAVKESSADIRRITALRAITEDRLDILVGVDDLLVEGVFAGATGWVAGLCNALPAESVALFRLAQQGPSDQLDALYRWFLPLLRLDVDVKLVQLIKLVQAEVGRGSPRVRPPRLELDGAELAAARRVIQAALKARPKVGKATVVK
jgi:4-hydroxy-tetrahydrodipicolinate synthase